MRAVGFTRLFAVFGLLIGACIPDYDDGRVPNPAPPSTPEPSTLRDALAGRLALDLAPATESGGSRLTAVATGKQAEPPQMVDLELVGGILEVRTGPTGELLIETLEADAGDASIDATLVPPSGCLLTELHLSLGRIASGSGIWSPDGESVVVDAELELAFDWSVVFGDGEVIPLATLKLGAIPFSFSLVRSADGTVTAHLSALHDGEFWSFDDWFVLSDLRLTVDATAL